MKIRLDFVTNSSSSSYTCCVCENEESGWDLGLYEAGMVECENGHVFCENHIIGFSSFDDFCEHYETIVEEFEYDEDNRDSIPEKYCPICSFEEFIPEEIVIYLLSKINMNKKKILSEIKDVFGNYKKFKKLIDKLSNISG